ncbi:glycosyltransferase family 2 protein [Pyxidicoccus sp. MSG2]|uniref:glycosyltransferase family 2 protein n=1 Tax=Pyxidicoccus sp. MSG2 TaxID=2996790 RepID=UPI00226E90BA|nr:glycosyltransferase family A protein [Pyxidicoccus sp. MSG2]MCY1022008.1 glycosyltransferase family A protein [Pyxidicoccus sp. MSG2]
MRRPEDIEGESESLAARLRAFVLARVTATRGCRVALVGSDASLSRALNDAGCEVVEGAEAGPTHVVLMDEPSASALESVLGAWATAAPGAELLFGFRNAGAGASLLATFLEGVPARPGPSESAVRHRFAACGLRVLTREAYPAPKGRGPLPAEAERSLRDVFAQLRPDAEDDVVLYALAREANADVSTATASGGRSATSSASGGTLPPASTGLVPDLLSVIVWAGPEHRESLDEAVFSLACQDQRPLEVVVVEHSGAASPPGSGSAEACLETYRRIEDFSSQVVRVAPGEGFSAALRVARGQYLAFLDASGLVYPRHFVNLIAALKSGDAAWAVSRAYRDALRTSDGEAYVETKVPFPLGDVLELEHLRRHPWLMNAVVIDRARLAGIPLHLEDPATESPASLLLRLASVFEPLFINGLPTCEQRGPEPIAPGPALAEVRVLRPLGAWEATVGRARDAGQSAKDLRHRVLDTLNSRLKQWVPGLHGNVRAWVSKWSR